MYSSRFLSRVLGRLSLLHEANMTHKNIMKIKRYIVLSLDHGMEKSNICSTFLKALLSNLKWIRKGNSMSSEN